MQIRVGSITERGRTKSSKSAASYFQLFCVHTIRCTRGRLSILADTVSDASNIASSLTNETSTIIQATSSTFSSSSLPRRLAPLPVAHPSAQLVCPSRGRVRHLSASQEHQGAGLGSRPHWHDRVGRWRGTGSDVWPRDAD